MLYEFIEVYNNTNKAVHLNSYKIKYRHPEKGKESDVIWRYVRVRIDGEMNDLSEDIELEKNKKHSIEVVVDRIVIKEGVTARLTDSLETALRLGEGRVIIDVIGQEELLFSEHHACPHCGFSIGELEPRMFSFNSPFGACPSCDGLGSKLEVDVELCKDAVKM